MSRIVNKLALLRVVLTIAATLKREEDVSRASQDHLSRAKEKSRQMKLATAPLAIRLTAAQLALMTKPTIKISVSRIIDVIAIAIATTVKTTIAIPLKTTLIRPVLMQPMPAIAVVLTALIMQQKSKLALSANQIANVDHVASLSAVKH